VDVVAEESKVSVAPKLTHEKLPHITGATIVSSANNKKQVDSKSSASKLIPNSRTALMQNNLGAGVGSGNTENATSQDTRQEKFAEFLRTEKLKKYKRVPRVYQKRTPQNIKCPNCNKERQTRTRFETTGSQWCSCILCCWLGCYLTCCLPFCCKQCYNVRHVCRECFYQIGESGF